MKTPLRVLLGPSLVVAGAAAIMLPAPATMEMRVFQHLLSIVIQLAAAVMSAVLTWQAAVQYWAGSREGLLWKRASLAAALWAAGLLLQAVTDWIGWGNAYPSAADALYMTSAVVLLAAFADDLLRLRWWFPSWRRLLFYGATAVLWALVMGLVLWPAVLVPTGAWERTVNFLYATTGILLLSVAVTRAVMSRVGLVGSGWMGLMIGAGLLAVAVLGTVYLSWLEIYSLVHPINLLRVAAFCALSVSAAWHWNAWHRRPTSQEPGDPARRDRRSHAKERPERSDRHGARIESTPDVLRTD